MELDITLTNQNNMLNLIAVWLEDYQTMLQEFINEHLKTRKDYGRLRVYRSTCFHKERKNQFKPNRFLFDTINANVLYSSNKLHKTSCRSMKSKIT